MKLKDFLEKETVDLYYPKVIQLSISPKGINTVTYPFPNESQSECIRRNESYICDQYYVHLLDCIVENYIYDGETAIYILKEDN